MRKIGVTVGKFMPLHKGHELMISVAAQSLDKLVVIVSDKPGHIIPLAVRYNAVCDFVEKRGFTNVQVIYKPDTSPEPKTVDEYGTVLDEDFQQYWIQAFDRWNPTHIVSSDQYGKVLAEKMGINWFPVDPDRKQVPISATMIRNNIDLFFDYISDHMKKYFVKTIAIVGAESTGKSTMVNELASYFGCANVPEYGRVLSEYKNNKLTNEDFDDIIQIQSILIDEAKRETTHSFVITDTEAYTTYLFNKVYLNEDRKDILHFARDQEIDLYILLDVSVDWIDDGSRVLSDKNERRIFQNDLLRLLMKNNENFVVISGNNFKERQKQVARCIRDYINNET